MFYANKQIKLNADEYQQLLKTQEQNELKIGNFNIKIYYSEMLFGTSFGCIYEQVLILNIHCTKIEVPLRISSVNVTKSAVSCEFGQIY